MKNGWIKLAVAGILLWALTPAEESLGKTYKNVLSGVPEYNWYYGCAPTAAGMIIGYWDNQPDYTNLVDGDVSAFNDLAKNMIASPEHINDYWIAYGNTDPDPNPGGHSNNCIADFMHTSRSAEGLGDGGTWGTDMAPGMVDFAGWDNPATTAVDESYGFDAHYNFYRGQGGGFDYSYFKEEISSGRPVLIQVPGHAMVGYGYAYGLGPFFPSGRGNYFAAYDTWNDGTTPIDLPFQSFTDASGVEWWPWEPYFRYASAIYPVIAAVSFIPGSGNATFSGSPWDGGVPGHTPEPSSIILLCIGFFALFGWSRKRK